MPDCVYCNHAEAVIDNEYCEDCFKYLNALPDTAKVWVDGDYIEGPERFIDLGGEDNGC